MSDNTASNSGYSKHLEFYIHTVTFLVEDCLFRIAKEPLEAESTVFRDMFLLPQGDPETVEGQSDTSPVILRGITKKDFESLLRALMYRQHGTNRGPELDHDQWISVLKLSTMWDFHGLRNAAIQHLDVSSQSLNPIDKVELALQYDIREWLLPALLALARRSAPISVEEGRRIGFENALKLASVREKLKLRTVEEKIDLHRRRSGEVTRTYEYNTRCLVLGDRDKEAEKLDYTPFICKIFDL
ncbi:hypothetical protein PISMIDRAFT_682942 [Pisolithus microcarpus 441]|uniref:Unplaced genomic scaffold scaffold_97, whole genome shotgun sequence n=1 Tax=Pisolithus microcarpus 441 TaxID=765257 RepID=A0A0C9ZHZ7_9AGAM|nr:hypothetical protein PISMIDRAFT_682942 [Pisolithus microcarpus 441]